jgi:transposase
MAEKIELIHERVDDIPLIIGLVQQLHLPEILDHHIRNHGNHQGVSNGWLASVWMAYILSEGKHCKATVEEWVQSRHQMLERLLEQPIRLGEFNDDRLGIVLERLSRKEAWEAVEADLWKRTVCVYEVEIIGVRLDSTTSYGYHTSTEEGVMQYGYSKDHRPDLVQLKLMAAAAEPSGHLLASEVHAGDQADDPLYIPLINRVRQMLGRRGLLYVGDSKMAALETRAQIVANGDFYLMPLPLTGDTAKEVETWIDRVVHGPESAQLIYDGDELLGGGDEFERNRCAEVAGQSIQWKERVQVVRSRSLAQAKAEQLEQRLSKAEDQLRKLTPPPGRGKRQYREEGALKTAVEEVLKRHDVLGLLSVSWQRQEISLTRYVGRGRGGPHRQKRTEITVRYVLTEVYRAEGAINQQKYRLGFRVLVTPLPVQTLSLQQSMVHYRGGICLERDFHLVKDRPLGISPLYVRRDDQIIGKTHLLLLTLRLLTLIETQVRRSLAQASEQLAGLYEGQPKRATDRPTGTRLLKAFARAEITLTRIQLGGQYLWHITPLSPLLDRILGYLGLSTLLYTRLVENSS